MEADKNPFSPGAGSPPPELTGRDDLLGQAGVAISRIASGKYEQSMLMVGLRGVGKTVLLNRIRDIAEQRGYVAAQIEISEERDLAQLIVPPLRQILYRLDAMEGVSQKVKRGLRVLSSFIGAIKVKLGEVELSVNVDAEKGTADSGDLEADLTQLLVAVGEAAKDRKMAVAVIVDEMQYLSEREMSALIMAIHRISQQQLPVIMVGAGLPQLVGLAGRAKSYAERLFTYPNVGPLEEKDIREALQGPVSRQGVIFQSWALDEIVRLTEGYPYFLQEWGYQAWNTAEKSPISLADVKKATGLAVKKLDQSFFRVRFDRLTPREKDYMRALAHLGPGSHRSGDIADCLGVKVQSSAPLRSALIKKGMIYSPAHGDTAFTVPLFDQFMRRTMPKWQPGFMR